MLNFIIFSILGKEFHSPLVWGTTSICFHSAFVTFISHIHIHLLQNTVDSYSHSICLPCYYHRCFSFLSLPYTFSLPSCRVLACSSNFFHTVQQVKPIMLLVVKGNPYCSSLKLLLILIYSLWNEVLEWQSAFNMQATAWNVNLVISVFITFTVIPKNVDFDHYLRLSQSFHGFV